MSYNLNLFPSLLISFILIFTFLCTIRQFAHIPRTKNYTRWVRTDEKDKVICIGNKDFCKWTQIMKGILDSTEMFDFLTQLKLKTIYMNPQQGYYFVQSNKLKKLIAFPTVIVTDAQGREMARFVGYTSVQRMKREIAQAFPERATFLLFMGKKLRIPASILDWEAIRYSERRKKQSSDPPNIL